MRYFRIFIIHLQAVFEERGVVLVYLLMAIINPVLLALFWRGITNGGKTTVLGWTFQEIASYYIYLALLGGLLMAYIEDSVARDDIRDGQLTMYLLKPFSYLVKKFNEEFSFRVFRVGFGLTAFVIFYVVWGSHLLQLHTPLSEWGLIACVLILGFFVSFLFKMLVGLSAFWLIDVSSMYDLVEVVVIICAGYLMPLILMPTFLYQFLSVLPFAYMIYFPLLAFTGKLAFVQLWQVMGVQILWIGLFYGLYRVLWFFGVRRYTGVGQ